MDRHKLKQLSKRYNRHPAGDGQGRGGQFAPKKTENIPFGAAGRSIAARYLTDDQLNAIERYQSPTTDHYKTINSQLRGWKDPTDNVQQDIQNISDGLKALPTPDYEQIEGYQGHLNRFGRHIYNHVAFAKNYPSVGTEFEENSFLSTTITHGNDPSMAAFTGQEAVLSKLNIIRKLIDRQDG